MLLQQYTRVVDCLICRDMAKVYGKYDNASVNLVKGGPGGSLLVYNACLVELFL
jgi:hypothetical protein